MKKYSYYFFFICLSYGCTTSTVFERVRPVQYSALSGRMIYVPHPRVKAQPLSNKQNQVLRQKALEEQEALAEAYDRNMRMRRWQLQRATRRRYGDYGLHRGSGAEPVIGLTPETVPHR